MKPFSFDPEKHNETGCCPGHDWPVTHRWAGKYSSHHSKKFGSVCNKMAKRARRRSDKQRLHQDLDNEC